MQIYMASTYITVLNDDPAKKCEEKQQSASQQIPSPIRIICKNIDVHAEQALVSIFSICDLLMVGPMPEWRLMLQTYGREGCWEEDELVRKLVVVLQEQYNNLQ